MKKLIIHSPKHGDKIVLYDDKDHDLILKHTWHVAKFKNTFYAGTHIRVKGKFRNFQNASAYYGM